MHEFDTTLHQVVAVIAHGVVAIGVDIHLERFVMLHQTSHHLIGVLNVHIVIGRTVSNQQFTLETVRKMDR